MQKNEKSTTDKDYWAKKGRDFCHADLQLLGIGWTEAEFKAGDFSETYFLGETHKNFIHFTVNLYALSGMGLMDSCIRCKYKVMIGYYVMYTVQ